MKKGPDLFGTIGLKEKMFNINETMENYFFKGAVSAFNYVAKGHYSSKRSNKNKRTT